jgi:hypothetical protein
MVFVWRRVRGQVGFLASLQLLVAVETAELKSAKIVHKK